VLYPYANWRSGIRNYRPSGLYPRGVIEHLTQFCSGDPVPGWNASGIGAHFLVQPDGTVDQYLDPTDFVWHARGASYYFLGIEHMAKHPLPGNPSTQPPFCFLSEQQLYGSAALSAWLALLYGFPVQRSLGADLGTSGFKNHYDSTQPGSTWNSRHVDGIWKYDGTWFLNANDRVPSNSSPWTWETYQAVVNYYITWWQANWGIMGNASYWWYGPQSVAESYYGY
jgi:hypothetical protein